MFGSGEIKDHSGIELVAASLALSEHCGPAARIMSRHRSTPSKDWDVPEAIRQLPFLPSIESAYAQGYRRLIYNPGYTRAEQLIEYGKDALLISGWYGSEVSQVFMGSARHGGMKEEEGLLSRIIAIASTVTIPTSDGEAVVADLFVANGQDVGVLKKFKEVDEFIALGRRACPTSRHRSCHERRREGSVPPEPVRPTVHRVSREMICLGAASLVAWQLRVPAALVANIGLNSG